MKVADRSHFDCPDSPTGSLKIARQQCRKYPVNIQCRVARYRGWWCTSRDHDD
ncbi:unnamed protein product [Chondrus crispus]|uniref:Uncharacterized protein n=1 Tax=Chondrus crispus TaxID=2769 RepID=R7QHM3_CHOCR|nr:unnamed protein product [Chondrus crispus]CDF37992.1 unnamed protein product [Chondrus crispus]|eukprot:XP_005717861.1 unnamed protein product [Chondrus crispus]